MRKDRVKTLPGWRRMGYRGGVSLGRMLRLSLAALALLLLAACDLAPEASRQAFEESWAATREMVPPLPGDLSFEAETCKSTLGALREARVALPQPGDELLSNGVSLWFQTAMSIFFECLRQDDLTAAYEELSRIESMIAGLADR